jgi:hypothetical protein
LGLRSNKGSGTVTISDNTAIDIYADPIHISQVRSTTSVSGNTLTGWAENCFDVKASKDVTFTENTCSSKFTKQDEHGVSVVGAAISGVVLHDPDATALALSNINLTKNKFINIAGRGIASGNAEGSADTDIDYNYFEEVIQPIIVYFDDANIRGNVIETTDSVNYDPESSLYLDDIKERSSIIIGHPNESFSVGTVVASNNTILDTRASNSKVGHGIYVTNDTHEDLTIKNSIVELTDNNDSIYPLYLELVSTDPDWTELDYNTYYNGSEDNRVYDAGTVWDSGEFGGVDAGDWNNPGGSHVDDKSRDPNLAADLTLNAASNEIDAASGTVTLVDPDSSWPSSVITMIGTERGAFGYEDTPPGAGGDVGLYTILGK